MNKNSMYDCAEKLQNLILENPTLPVEVTLRKDKETTNVSGRCKVEHLAFYDNKWMNKATLKIYIEDELLEKDISLLGVDLSEEINQKIKDIEFKDVIWYEIIVED